MRAIMMRFHAVHLDQFLGFIKHCTMFREGKIINLSNEKGPEGPTVVPVNQACATSPALKKGEPARLDCLKPSAGRCPFSAVSGVIEVNFTSLTPRV
ncbi:MAG: hypothetical protein IPH43_04025 [Xanthomonadales bacterium]|nr:hypothetical protein [Xanthomonadales bacterium]